MWDLHLAFLAAAREGFTYLPSSEDGRSMGEYIEHDEAELALQLILAIARPPVPAALHERARAAARAMWPDEADEDVDGWLEWTLESGTAPPSWT